jgi:hypothetical protein
MLFLFRWAQQSCIVCSDHNSNRFYFSGQNCVRHISVHVQSILCKEIHSRMLWSFATWWYNYKIPGTSLSWRSCECTENQQLYRPKVNECYLYYFCSYFVNNFNHETVRHFLCDNVAWLKYNSIPIPELHLLAVWLLVRLAKTSKEFRKLWFSQSFWIKVQIWTLAGRQRSKGRNIHRYFEERSKVLLFTGWNYTKRKE